MAEEQLARDNMWDGIPEVANAGWNSEVAEGRRPVRYVVVDWRTFDPLRRAGGDLRVDIFGRPEPNSTADIAIGE